jgi:hypothetical protein
MGDRIDRLRPTPVLLPKSKGWKWNKVKICNDALTITAFGKNPENADKFWAPPEEGMEDIFVPVILHIPYIVASFALEQPHTCWEMYKEIARLVASNSNEMTGENFTLLTTWFVAAAHGSDEKSILSLKMQAAATSAPSFQKWVQMQLYCTMGREATHSPLTPARQPTTDISVIVAAGITAGIAHRQQAHRTVEQILLETTQKAEKGQWYDKYGVAALQGWYRTRLIPQIWSLFEGTKKVDTHQLNIEIDMQVWAVRKGAELNRGIVLAKGNR